MLSPQEQTLRCAERVQWRLFVSNDVRKFERSEQKSRLSARILFKIDREVRLKLGIKCKLSGVLLVYDGDSKEYTLWVTRITQSYTESI